ncbi:MAG: N-acetylmuramoyl-L-alanine amidase [Planctomycetes bacterium]|nr:N-acetylmuramoyl-L-alanine amidase [Planctomycetota bacterium]
MKKQSLLVLLILASFVGQVFAGTHFLYDYVPEAKKSGRFDALGARFEIPGLLILLRGSKWCQVKGEMLKLSIEPRYTGSDWIIPDELASKFMAKKSPSQQNVAKKPPLYGGPKPLIILDAGHGGKDPGAVGLAGTFEKDVVLDLALRSEKILKAHPVQVQLVRRKDEYVDLHHRCDISNRARASLYVSIHCNSIANREVKGYQIFRQSQKISTKRRADFSKKRFSLPQYTPTPIKGLNLSFRNHEELFRWKDRSSKALSESIHLSLKYRDSKVSTQPQSNLCVLRETMAPSVLVEVDFISNPEVEFNMNLSQWREEMAQDMCRGILMYLGLGPQS